MSVLSSRHRTAARWLDRSLLRSVTDRELAAIFMSPDVARSWNAEGARLAEICKIEDGKTGGVNPGDRRALFHLISALKPKSVLEIGTHVGASTVHIAAAMPHQSSLTSVDIEDVNGPNAYWKRFGLARSPKQMIDELGRHDLSVDWFVSDSMQFLDNTNRRFDMVFLDGDHEFQTVVREIPGSLRVLNRNGIIVLHDYFPNNMPLWSDGLAIPGPFEAVKQLCSQKMRLKVMPIGALPWPTKLGTNVTSLAVLTAPR